MSSNNKIFKLEWGILLLLLFLVFSAPGQDEKKKARIRLGYFNENGSASVNVKVTTRVDKKFEPVEGVIINLFLDEETKQGMMGNITTDENGEGKFLLPSKFYEMSDTLYHYNFIARLSQDQLYQDQRASLSIHKVNMEMSLIDQDTLRQIKVQVMQPTDSGAYPVTSLHVKFFVERLFSDLPFGGDYNFTDESGTVVISFPEDLPGNDEGLVNIISKLIDHEDFGNVSVSKVTDWGKNLDHQADVNGTMWAPRANPPWPMVVFPNLALLVVWGYIIYLIIIIVRIKTAGNAE
ncbi:MAG: hypothetical protein R3345_06595 [Fulvivirga sp.]|nr:hypothetical protein [Fulvivirga sp.]